MNKSSALKVGIINGVSHGATTWNKALLQFCVAIQDFNIRGQRDEIAHPGYAQEYQFCTDTGAPVDYAALGLKTYKEMIASPVVKAVARLQSMHPRSRRVEFATEMLNFDRILFSHDEFLADYQQNDDDFIFDARSGLYLVGATGSHIIMLGYLYGYHTGPDVIDFEVAADRFVEEGYGLLKSRAGYGWVYRGKDFEVPGALASIAQEMKVLS